MESQSGTPAGALIRLARQAAGLSIPDAVRLSGVSKARWSQVESGTETRAGITRPVTAKADTLARMARAVGLSPERLEAEGERPDAAEVLREMIRSAPPPAPPVLAAVPPPPPPAEPDDEAMRRYPSDRTKRALWRAADPKDREALMEWLDERRGAYTRSRRADSA